VTPTQTAPIRIARALLIELHAGDFNSSTGAWDNRVTPGAVSEFNGEDATTLPIALVCCGSTGACVLQLRPCPRPTTASAPTAGDFVPDPQGTAGTVSWPTPGVLGGAPALSFTSDDGTMDRLVTLNSVPSFAGLYGTSDFSWEAWAYPLDEESNSDSAVLQFAKRPGTGCDSAYLGVGNNPGYGAGGFWYCDMAYGAGSATQLETIGGATGYRPTAFQWAHIAVTYSGTPESLLTLYVNGAVSGVFNRTLDINRGADPHIRVGAWYDDGEGAYSTAPKVALAIVRAHDGELSPADVLYNFLAEAPSFIATPTPTPTGSATASGTGSPSGSPSSTQVSSLSSSATASATATPSACPTSFGATHALRAVSFQNPADPTAYLRRE
jgi:hypothetical protein